MTPEQLDEIEKLAEAGGFVPRTAAESAYARALRDHTLPLVKALREAREDAHKHREDALAWVQVSFAHQRERDAAKAEAAELRKKRNADLLALEKAMDASAEGSWMARALDAERERDEARAEVERLKEEVRVAWAQKADSDVWRNRYRAELRNAEALLAALKEEHRPADEVRAQLLAEIEAHAETKAEVERLRSVLRLLWGHANNAWIPRACRDAVEAALKEGDR